jgi:hypothetical protein
MTHNHNIALPAFSKEEYQSAKIHLATQVAHMMGRKLEEGDWGVVYCEAKNIPFGGWSNLNIDVNHGGLGVEHKLLRCSSLNGKPIKNVCGTALMHPAATRSIRIDDTSRDADEVMRDVFRQYAELIAIRTEKVRKVFPKCEPDMRIGWLLWEDSLTEFLYFEQPLATPDPNKYYAQWNETPARGARKASKSLWIFERSTNKKRYSVTTSAGIKIQPYFDVPSPADPNLYYFRVQSEPIDAETVQIWVAASTARTIKRLLGSLDKDKISDAIIKADKDTVRLDVQPPEQQESAQPIQLTTKAFEIFKKTWHGVSDEHSAQLFVESLHSAATG